MNADAQLIQAANDGANSLIALSCFCIALSFLHFAARNRGARLAPAFAVFAVLFAVGGLVHASEVLRFPLAGAIFRVLTSLACAAAAVFAVRCLPAARVMFSRVAVIDRRVADRLERLKADPRYDTREDQEAARLLGEIRDLARLAREAVKAEEV